MKPDLDLQPHEKKHLQNQQVDTSEKYRRVANTIFNCPECGSTVLPSLCERVLDALECPTCFRLIGW